MKGRPSYDLLDILRTARGFPSTEGYAVLSKAQAQDIESELKRLYELEDTLSDELGSGAGSVVSVVGLTNMLEYVRNFRHDCAKLEAAVAHFNATVAVTDRMEAIEEIAQACKELLAQ